MKRKRKILLVSAGGLVLVGLVIGGIVWSRRGVVTVQTAKVGREDLSSIVTASGEIKPPEASYANVNANSFGRITEIDVREGDKVKKGQLLMKTESVQQEANVQAQEAALKTSQADQQGAQAAVQSAAASLKSAQAELLQAQATASRAQEDFNRGKELMEENLIAQQVFDQRQSDFKVAQANVQAAQAKVAQAQALHQQALESLAMARARVAQNQAQLVGVKDARDKTIYIAPLDGIVTSLPVHLGENVVPGIQNQPGSLLYQISDLAVITAEVKVDETDIVNVKLGQPAEVTIDAIPNKTFKGKVTQIGQSALLRNTGLTTSQTTANPEEAKDFKVVATLDDPPPGLRPGLSTTAKITTATRQNVITVPIQSLTVRMKRELEEQAKAGSKGKVQAAATAPKAASSPAKDKEKEELQGVFELKDGRAVFVPIESGIMGSTDVEITKGIKPGDEIVTGPFSVLRTLKNHTKLKVNNNAAPPGGPSS